MLKELDNFDFTYFRTLPDERDSVKAGDVVIADYFMAGVYEFEVLDMTGEGELENMGNSDDYCWCDLASAVQVTKKETYDLHR